MCISATDIDTSFPGRMSELHKTGKPLFRDQRELTVVVNYMIESGMYS